LNSMRLLIASDIHGSAVYCKKLVETFVASGADHLVLLGDILYHGPRNDLPAGYAPKEVIDMLNPLSDRILAVRGNCESEVDGMVLAFPVSADYGMIHLDGITMYFSHGHRQIPKMPEGAVYMTGHTHVPLMAIQDGIVCLNPGSTSIPKEGSPHSYMLYEEGVFTWHDLVSGGEYKHYSMK